jgi:exodeoxyribonuclease-5
MTITLTEQQAAGLEKIAAWYNGRQTIFDAWDPFRFFGYAGTGKTFTAARIPEHLGLRNVMFGTYTGKAASVLRRSLAKYGANFDVSTIHSAIYMPTTSAEAQRALEDARDEIANLSELVLSEGDEEILAKATEHMKDLNAKLPELEANARRLSWELNPASEWALADLIVLDEVSMVNAKLAADIESFGVPILVLGDPAQLPPVEGGGYYTDAEPDHLLTDIQRTALDSPVTELATRVRESTDSTLGMATGDMSPASLAETMAADVVLVWSNKRRWAMINAIRKRKFGLTDRDPRMTQPVPGDTIMVLTNNRDMAVFNGELFDVLSVREGTLGPTLTVRSETGQERSLPVFWEGFGGLEKQQAAKASGAGGRGQRALATFGQAITVHKAQGSEWPHVYVVNELPQMISMVSKREGRTAALEQARKWAYTAATRAQEKVTITRPR